MNALQFPKHRYFLYPIDSGNAPATLQRMEKEGFDPVSISAYVVNDPRFGPVLMCLITSRCSAAAPESPLEREWREKQEQEANRRIITPGS